MSLVDRLIVGGTSFRCDVWVDGSPQWCHVHVESRFDGMACDKQITIATESPEKIRQIGQYLVAEADRIERLIADRKR